ncbi:MAG: hypothetical protein AAF251_04735 [Pseudomonadota bacterium]
MNAAQIEVIGWICVAFFGLSAAVWLLDLVTSVIKNESQRVILNRTIGGTLLGAIVSFVAAAVLGQGQPGPKPTPSPTPTAAPLSPPIPAPTSSASATPAPEPTSPSPTPTPTVFPTSDPESPQPPPNAPPIPSGDPPELLAWAEENLPPRPFLDQPLGSTYPPCALKLRGVGAPSGPSSDAGSCYALLQDYNSEVLNQHRDRRETYLPAVKERARSEANNQRWQYLRREYASFTFGKDAENYNRLSAVWRCDTHLMINLRDFGLAKERAGCPSALSEDE